ncbi:MAG: hypothetical protein ITG02_01090 [Patulibacter sp.]|nr:hypothetical protein [Patulibacter sp.]
MTVIDPDDEKHFPHGFPIELDFLVDQFVWVRDHVRRRVVSADGRFWTDEDGIELDLTAIDRVIVGGSQLNVEHAMQILDQPQNAEYCDYRAMNGGYC